MQLHDRVVLRRTKIGLSRADLAAKLGMKVRDLWRKETGRTRILADEVPAFARALRTRVSWLYGERKARPDHSDAAA